MTLVIDFALLKAENYVFKNMHIGMRQDYFEGLIILKSPGRNIILGFER